MLNFWLLSVNVLLRNLKAQIKATNHLCNINLDITSLTDVGYESDWRWLQLQTSGL